MNTIKQFYTENMAYFIFLVIVTLLELLVVLFIFISTFTFFSAKEVSAIQNGIVVDQGDRLMWLGMEIVPLSKAIRKEFSIPAKIKGMFVLDAGNVAETQGIQEGDVICAANQSSTSDRKSFLKTANAIHYFDGVLLDLYRNGRKFYVAVPIFYPYGPQLGPYKGQWQLGSPLMNPVLPYGPLLKNP